RSFLPSTRALDTAFESTNDKYTCFGVMKEATASKSKLGARWQLNASMLSRPADLSALVTLSQSKPEEFFVDDTLHVLVNKLLNCRNEQVSDKDTKLDVLA
ncbi:unnamed protein product, partial [Ectocarpus sp. 13 AM-2016]